MFAILLKRKSMLYPSLYLMYLPSDCHVIGSQYIYIFFFLFFFFFLFKELCRVNLSRYIAKLGFHHGLDGKDSASNVGDLGLISGSGRSTGKGNGNPLQYSCLENSMDGGAWQATVCGVAKVRHN